MGRDANFWTWQLDHAAEQTHTRVLCAATLLFYLAGALLLIAQPHLGLSTPWTRAGAALIVLAVLASAGICTKLIVARTRLGFR
jgi:hypothetical protein